MSNRGRQIEVTGAIDSIAKKAIRVETRKGKQPSVLDNLATRLIAALERADSGEYEGPLSASAPASGGGSGSGGGASILVPNELGELERVSVTSVEALVDELGGHRVERDLVRVHARVGLANVMAAARALDVALERMRAIDELSDPDNTVAHREAICCEPHCEDPAARGRTGRCEADYQWRRRWAAAHPGEVPPPVPADVISARIEERDRTRQRADQAESAHG